MKKIVGLVSAGALMLVMAVPAFAYRPYRSSDDTSIRNYARVSNSVEVKADTGDNSVSGKYVRGGRIETGSAEAYGDIFNRVNYVEVEDPSDDLSIRNMASIRNRVEVKADTGDNSVSGKYVRGGRIYSGDADAGSLVDNTVNTVIVID